MSTDSSLFDQYSDVTGDSSSGTKGGLLSTLQTLTNLGTSAYGAVTKAQQNQAQTAAATQLQQQQVANQSKIITFLTSTAGIVAVLGVVAGLVFFLFRRRR